MGVGIVRGAALAWAVGLAGQAWPQISAPVGQVGDGQRADEPPSRHVYAFPDEAKEPLDDAAHVRNAVARFNQVKGVTDAERDAAWARIQAAAERFGVNVRARDWRELKPRKPPPSAAPG